MRAVVSSLHDVILKEPFKKKVNKYSNNSQIPGIFQTFRDSSLISIVMVFRGYKITLHRASCVFTDAALTSGS